MIKKIYLLLIIFSLFFLIKGSSYAQVSKWQKSASIVPVSTIDFSSSSFKQSLNNLAAIKANYVTLIIPYYQTNLFTTDLSSGYNTPTDQSLVDAIRHAHSLGLKVALKIHAESNTGEWRAGINPSDRNGWFANYGNILNHYADLGQGQGVEEMVLGAELYRMSSGFTNNTNTTNWNKLISQVRSRFAGFLSYSANHTGPSEENEVQFWNNLDNIGLAAYFPLAPNNNNPTIDSLKASWDSWNNQIIKPLNQKWNKPVLFTELGYRSLVGAHNDPWNHSRQDNIDQKEQVRDYEALFSYWNTQTFMNGLHIWDWESNPSAGGADSTSYTPQNKEAQTTIAKWFGESAPTTTPTTSPPAPSPNSNPSSSYTFNASSTPNSPAINNPVTLNVAITAGSFANENIVDIELYDSNNIKILQKFFEHQSFNANQTLNYDLTWTPTNAGSYKLKVGIFNNDWTVNYFWMNNALVINVGSSPQPSSPTPTPIPTSAPTTTPTPTPTPTTQPNNPPDNPKTINIWWPTNGLSINGVQPYKAMLTNMDISSYDMFWQVDGGTLNVMQDNLTDYPHKESLADVNPWTWNGNGPYTINFIAKDKTGNTISQSSIAISISR